MIDQYVDFVKKRPKTIVAIIILITALFLIPVSKIKAESSIDILRSKEIIEPLERLRSTQDLPFLYMSIIGNNNESMISLEALKEQLKVVEFLQSNFKVKTQSVAELVDAEIMDKYNKSIADMESEEELSETLIDLFKESPEDFESAAQRTLSKDYDANQVGKAIYWQTISEIIPFAGFFVKQDIDAPHTKMTIIYVTMENKSADEDELEQAAINIRESVDALDLKHLKIGFVSDKLIMYDLDQLVSGNTAFLAVLTVLAMSFLIFLSFRRLHFVFTPLVIMIVATVWTFGTAQLISVKIHFFHTFVIPLLVGIALDAPLHLTKRFLEQRKKDSFDHSLKVTVRSMLPALFLTFITTAAAFSAQLVLPSIPALVSFALVVIIGVTYSFLLVFLLWPALMVIKSHSPIQSSGRIVMKTMAWVFDKGSKHSKMIMTCIMAALILSVYGATRIETNTNIYDMLPDGVPSKEAILISDSYAALYNTEFVLIEGDVLQPEIIEALDRLEQNIQDNTNFQRIGRKVKFESINTLLRDANTSDYSDLKKAFDNLHENTAMADPVAKQTFADKARLTIQKEDGTYKIIIVTVWPGTETYEMVKQVYDQLMVDIEQSGLNDIKGIDIKVTGTAFANEQTESLLRKIQRTSSILMFIFTFLVLLIIYRRFSTSLIVSVPILIGAMFSLGLMPLLDIPLNSLNTSVIPLIIGLGVDYSIYLTARYKEELKRNRNRKEAARTALIQTGEGNWIAALSTTVGFVIISFSFLPMARTFGVLTSLSIMLTFLVTIFLLPTLLVRFVKE
ncbi:MMPL family transporter [Candidatus Woesearchaeota archaeon]|nr:MMPL family transporter [Candidatus Woesearchaeota archaeon]